MTHSISEVAAAYFTAKNAHDVDGMVECFTTDAVVRDEGEDMEMRGKDAIRKWLEGTIARYKLRVEVTDVAERDGETVATTLVSGDFPGSPIEFAYHLIIAGGKIEKMVIK